MSAPYMLRVLPEFRLGLESAGVEIITLPVTERLTEADLLTVVERLDGVICGDDPFTERVLRAAVRLRVISKWGTGIDSIDSAAAARLGIRVCNTPGAFTDPVADTVLGYVLCFARGIPWMDSDVRRGLWNKRDAVALRGRTLGIAGLGNIGQAVARRALAFGMNLRGCDPVLPPNSFLGETGIVMTDLPVLLAESDFVSLNCDLNPTSLHLIGRAELAMLRPTAYVINTARGAVVDEASLAVALREGRIAGAALDVFETEPLPADSPLRALDRCLLAPHNSNSDPSARNRVHESTVSNLVLGLHEVTRTPGGLPARGIAGPATQPGKSQRLRSHAVVVHGAGRASLEQVDVAEVRGADVAIEVAYAGICATDLEIFAGTLGYYRDGIAGYPIVPGHELSGRVAEIGSDVGHLTSGDRVVVECIQGCGECDACRSGCAIGCADRTELGVIRRNGGYADCVVVPARFVHRIPESVDLRSACLCEPLAVVVKGLGRLRRCWGEGQRQRRCAVVGAGPLGRLCASVLVHRGHRVTLIDKDQRRLAGVPSTMQTSRTLSGLYEFDAIVEATGQQAALETAVATSRAGAAILLLGLPYGEAAFSFETIVAYDRTIVGSVGSDSADFEEALTLLPVLDMSPFITEILPLGEFQHGWDIARSRSCLKVLLAPSAASRDGEMDVSSG